MTKEEIIKEAYKNHYWLYSECENAGDGYIFMTEGLDFHNIWEEIPLDKHPYLNKAYRPSSLKGLDDNRGWISLKENGLPNDDSYYFVNIDNHISIKQFNFLQYKYWQECVTHYQPIIKPKPPIY